MGKAKRSRDKKALDILNNPSAYAEKKEKNQGTALKIALSVIAVIVVASLLFSFIQSTGFFLRNDYGYKTDNFEIDGAMMQYLYSTQIHNFYATYGQYLQIYEQMGYSIVNLSGDLKNQEFSSTAKQLFGVDFKGTWFEFFWQSTEASAKQVLVLCEAALKEGLYDDYEKELKDTIEADIESYREVSKDSQYSFNEYIELLFGDGVKVDDVRRMETMAQIAAKYYSFKTEQFLDAITEDQVNSYHEEHKSNYLKVDYIISSFTASLGSNPSEEEKAQFLKDVEDARAFADAVSKLETVEAIEEYMVGYWFDYNFEETLDKAFEDAKTKAEDLPTTEQREEIRKTMRAFIIEKALADAYVESKDGNCFDKETETHADILNKVTKNLITTSRNSLEKINIKKEAFAEESDRDKWIFSADRKEGDVEIFYGTEEKSEDPFNAETDKSYVVNVFRVIKPAYLEEDLTVDFGHILLQKSGGKYTDATERVNKIRELEAQFKAGEMTAEAFEALGKDVTEDSNVFYEGVKPGEMVTEINDWIFSADRKEGDVEVVESADYGLHLMYFKGQNKPIWFVDSRNDLHTETVENWYKEIEKATEGSILINKEITNKISQPYSFANYSSHTH